MTHAGKAVKDATQDMVDSMITSTSTGFGHLTAAPKLSVFHAAVDASDYGARPNAVLCDGDFLKAAAAQLMTSPRKAAQVNVDKHSIMSGPGGAGASTVAATAPPQPDEKTLPCDPVQRNKVVRTISSDVSKEIGNLKMVLKCAAPVLHQSDSAGERITSERHNLYLLVQPGRGAVLGPDRKS